jgi:uncharacterized repeat protein (TIGR03803 family)
MCYPASASTTSRVRPMLVWLTAFVLASCTFSFAQSEQALFDFTNIDGNTPQAGLVADASGAFYGTTSWGGNGGLGSWGGTVYKLAPPTAKGSGWTQTVLYSFTYNGQNSDAANPYCTLILDPQGNLYGTTEHGGRSGNGTIFQLVPPSTSGGAWTENILAEVTDTPFAGLVMDAAGNMYGSGFDGDIFELSPPTVVGGQWTVTPIASVGDYVSRSLIMDGKGNLYGTTQQGGRYGQGSVFGVKPPTVAGGPWSVVTLHSFSNHETPMSSLTRQSGTLYGTTQFGGANGQGTVFSLSPPTVAGQSWTLNTLYSFQGGTDGAQPEGGVTIGTGGVLYGTTNVGGSANFGTVYKLTPPAIQGEPWTETVLHSFTDTGHDGGRPETNLILVKGSFYGTTEQGGDQATGTVFRVTP